LAARAAEAWLVRSCVLGVRMPCEHPLCTLGSMGSMSCNCISFILGLDVGHLARVCACVVLLCVVLSWV
jgi:hypothetical protein